MKKYVKEISFYLLMFVLFISMVFLLTNNNKMDQKTYSQLVRDIHSGQIKQMEITESNKAYIIYNNDKKAEVDIPSKDILYRDAGAAINEQILKQTLDITTPVSPGMPWWVTLIPPLGIVLVAVFFWMFFMKQSQGGGGKAMSFGKSRAKVADTDKNKVTFADVAGADEEKEDLSEIVDFLKDPSKFTEIGARVPKGVLLVGPPGTGKTLLAKAIAGEAGVTFFSISGSDFVEMYVGVGASRVRDLFEQAKKSAPCIIFIDEIDAVGRHRGAGLGGGHDEREQTLNQLLVEMDGFASNTNIIVIAATNRPDILDPALLRPGRFDRQIVVNYPDIKGREEILKVHARGKKFEPDVSFKVLAKTTQGFTGADLENLLNEAALLTARGNRKLIGNRDLEEAMIKVIAGPEKRSRKITKKEKRLTAYHEAGHAIVTALLPSQDKVHQISIIPRGMAGGYTLSLPSHDKSYSSKIEMEEEIVALLGGRVAEKLILDDISTGASNDIQRATKIAKDMVTKYGMSDRLGTRCFGTGHDEVFIGKDFGQTRDYSESIAAEIDEEIKSIIDTAYEKCKELLETNIQKLHEVAQALLEKEKLDEEEFMAIFPYEKEEQEDLLADEVERDQPAEEPRLQPKAEDSNTKESFEK